MSKIFNNIKKFFKEDIATETYVKKEIAKSKSDILKFLEEKKISQLMSDMLQKKLQNCEI